MLPYMRKVVLPDQSTTSDRNAMVNVIVAGCASDVEQAVQVSASSLAYAAQASAWQNSIAGYNINRSINIYIYISIFTLIITVMMKTMTMMMMMMKMMMMRMMMTIVMMTVMLTVMPICICVYVCNVICMYVCDITVLSTISLSI